MTRQDHRVMRLFKMASIDNRDEHLRDQANKVLDALAFVDYASSSGIAKHFKTSGAGASKEPQASENNPSKGGVLLTSETEGRGSGGERANHQEDAK